jgi:hypothetical protein
MSRLHAYTLSPAILSEILWHLKLRERLDRQLCGMAVLLAAPSPEAPPRRDG